MDTGDVKFGAKVGTENECMSACALSEGCTETTFSQKDKRCFPSKQAVVHEVTDGTGDFWTMQCHSLTPDEIKTTGADGVDAPVKKEEQEQAAKAQAGNTTQAQQPQAGNQTQAQAQEIDAELNKKKQPTPAEAKQEKKDAAEKAKAAKAEAKEKEEELKKREG